MTHLSQRIILGSREAPLVWLEEYELDRGIDFEAARDELSRYIRERADDSHTWGYFPEITDDSASYPACMRLGEALRAALLPAFPENERLMELAFIRMASQEPVSEYGGLHIDADKGIMHERPAANRSYNILRTLVNLSESIPRKLGYTKETAGELRSMGTDISEFEYKRIELPPQINLEVVEIPPRTWHSIHVLKLWSDLIPHMGLTDRRGHFLAAYGMYAKTPSSEE